MKHIMCGPWVSSSTLICSSPHTANYQVDDWDFDPFELDTATQGHPIVTLGAYLFEVKYNFFSCFGLSKVKRLRESENLPKSLQSRSRNH